MAPADAQHDLPHEAVEGSSHEPTSAYAQVIERVDDHQAY